LRIASGPVATELSDADHAHGDRGEGLPGHRKLGPTPGSAGPSGSTATARRNKRRSARDDARKRSGPVQRERGARPGENPDSCCLSSLHFPLTGWSDRPSTATGFTFESVTRAVRNRMVWWRRLPEKHHSRRIAARLTSKSQSFSHAGSANPAGAFATNPAAVAAAADAVHRDEASIVLKVGGGQGRRPTHWTVGDLNQRGRRGGRALCGAVLSWQLLPPPPLPSCAPMAGVSHTTFSPIPPDLIRAHHYTL
jgi:hypothetical protein